MDKGATAAGMPLAYLYVAASAVLYGFITVGGRWLAQAGLSLYEISLFPLSVVGLVLILGKPARLPVLFHRRALGFFAGYGLIGALLQITQYGGIVLGVPVAVVAMLLYTQPIWTMLLSRVLFGERITPRKLLAVALALAGVIVLLNPAGAAGSAYSTAGLLFALSAGLVLAGWVIWGKRSERLPELTPLTKVCGYALFSALWLLTLHPLAGVLFRDPVLTRISLSALAGAWPRVIAVAVAAYLLPYICFFRGIAGVEATSAGTLLMLEPVSASLLAAVLFSEALTWHVLAGGALILAANYLVIRGGRPV